MTFTKVEKLLRDDGGWLVKRVGQELQLIRTFSGKAIVVRLCKAVGGYEILFPSYLFESKISHYAPVVDEIRFSRNKSIITSLVHYLQRTGIWDNIVNKHFVKINRKNKRSDKDVLTGEIKELLDRY